MNRVVSTFTMVLGLAFLMMGVYAEQWNTIHDFVVRLVPIFP